MFGRGSTIDFEVPLRHPRGDVQQAVRTARGLSHPDSPATNTTSPSDALALARHSLPTPERYKFHNMNFGYFM